MRPYANPAWSNCALLQNWDALEYHVGAARMPRVKRHDLEHLEAVEYGSGNYGVVMPCASARGVVCKVTSDESEARFIAAYHALRTKPAGVVKYGSIFSIEGTHDGRHIFVLWREEATDVGKVFTDNDAEAHAILNAMFDNTSATCDVACDPKTPRETLKRVTQVAQSYEGHTGFENGETPGIGSKIKGAFSSKVDKAGKGVAIGRELAREMARIPKFAAVGKAMLDLSRAGILVTDVHDGNFGLVHRGGRKTIVLTDPGNVAFLTTRFDHAAPPPVERGLPANVLARWREDAGHARCDVK